MARSDVIDLLKREIVDIEFVKKDGTIRPMMCTLREESLPKQVDIEELINTRKGNPDVLAVFDVINQGWRSFRWDSLKKVNGEEFV